MSGASYGDNIFRIAGLVRRTLHLANWDEDQIEQVMARIQASQSYSEAVKVCAEFITIEDMP